MKFFWRKFWRFLVRCWFSMFFALKVFSKFFSGNRKHGVYGGFGAFFCSGCLSLGIPLEFRYISVLPPMILRYFFDHSSINLRFPNGAWTELERSLNGAWTELERSLNGGSTEDQRRINGAWTENERRTNGERTRTERRANGGVNSLSQAFCVPSVWYRNAFGIVVRQNGACFSKLTSAKLQREKAKSKFSANLWHFESAERWKWKYKANNGSPVNPCVWLFE